MLLAKTWLEECVNQHPECQTQQPGYRTLPTRVLDVSLERIRLLETHEMGGNYAILSHCWGPKPFITTKLRNIATRCQNIEFSTLSKTFQDAVTVTRSLGLKYLWIDSLCIVQDSKKDWEIESSKMGTYYTYAQICIAASAASEGSIGCFFERHPANAQPIPLFIRLSGADHLTLILTRVERLWVRNFMSPLPGLLGASGPLETRGWALQETIMSKRMLRFRRYQIEWVCKTKYASEGDRLGKPAPMTAEWDCFRALEILGSQISRFGPLSRHNIWYEMVEQYTQRELSYGTDTLPALSGIATRYQEMTTDVYLAGIWKSDLTRGLLWRPPNWWHLESTYDKSLKFQEASRPAIYRAPSWSWASIDAISINWDLISDWSSIDAHNVTAELVDEAKRGESCYKLIDINMSVDGFNKFGSVSNGKLTIQGFIKSVEVWAFEEGTERTYWDDNIRQKIGAETVLIGRFDSDESGYEPPRILILPIVRPKQPTREAEAGKVEERVLCLALEAINGDKCSYSRVGIASIVNWEIFNGIESTELTIL